MMLICLLFLVSGCKEKLTYDYLMMHPNTLEREAMRCQFTVDAPQCNMILNTAADFISLANAQHNNPEQFGETIMQAEVVVQQFKEKIEVIQQKKLSSDMKEQLKKTEDAYHRARQRVKIFLAVMRVLRENGI
jgi:hypothetical protein